MFETKHPSEKVDLLNSLRIAAPCNVAWNSMEGGNRVRHCSQCDKNVYNLSSMSKDEANEFLQITAQGACVNFYKRADGTILVDNCPVGLRQLRAQYRKVAAAVTTLIAFAQSLFLIAFAGNTEKSTSSTAGCKTSTSPDAQRMGGVPLPMDVNADKPSVIAYKKNAKKQLDAAMPKTSNLGHAAMWVSIAPNGSVDRVVMVSPSPNKATDALIQKTAQKVKFSPLPAESSGLSMFVYYECHVDK